MNIPLICGFVGFSILGWALGPNPFGYASFLLALGFLLGVVIHGAAKLSIRRRDPYDLAELARIHESEERRAIENELMEIDSAGNAVCLCCGNHFDPKLHLCPRCGRSIFC